MILLECGAFSTINGEEYNASAETELTPMSQHKWRKLAMAAEQLGILPYIAQGAELMRETGVIPIALYNMFDNPDKSISISEYNTSTAQLYNHWTSKRLDSIREEEMNSAVISEETLTLLDIIITNADAIITQDVSIEGIIALGYYIRHHREQIDFDKLQQWISHIGMIRMASLQATMLVSCMHFNSDELPFLIKEEKNAKRLFMNSFTKALKKHSCSNSARMNVAMLETLSHKFFSAISLVTDVEE